MRRAVGLGVINVFVAGALGALATGAVWAADAPAASAVAGGGYAALAKLPDWSGVWDLDYRGGGGLTRPAPPHLTAEYAKKYAEYQARQKKGEEQQTETANCVPPGMPMIMAQPYPVEFLFTPGKITVAIEAYSQMRRIFTDGRKHPADPDPSYQGNSIGHWEGDTLVVDTVGFVDTTLLAPGVAHTEDMHMVERIHMASPERMVIESTVTDPKVLMEPWTFTKAYQRHKDWDIKEYICDQNNRDSADDKGKAGLRIER